MPSGGRLEIRVKQCTAQAVMLEVSDSGIGIDASPIKQGRAGLGLTIVRSVVARQGGALRIVSRPTGGTVAAVMLPTSSSSAA
jgi:signal transduction histidine kinase